MVMTMQGISKGHPHAMGHPQSMGHPHGMSKGIDYDVNPFIVIWEVTRACQLKCVHCRADAQLTPDPRELTHEEGINLIDQIYEMDNPMLVFSGGDCMMRKTFLSLLIMQLKKGCALA